jgi:hypothetical protein
MPIATAWARIAASRFARGWRELLGVVEARQRDARAGSPRGHHRAEGPTPTSSTPATSGRPRTRRRRSTKRAPRAVAAPIVREPPREQMASDTARPARRCARAQRDRARIAASRARAGR